MGTTAGQPLFFSRPFKNSIQRPFSQKPGASTWASTAACCSCACGCNRRINSETKKHFLWLRHWQLLLSSAPPGLLCSLRVSKPKRHAKTCVSSLRRGHANLLCIVPICAAEKPTLFQDPLQRFSSLLNLFLKSRHCPHWPAGPNTQRRDNDAPDGSQLGLDLKRKSHRHVISSAKKRKNTKNESRS